MSPASDREQKRLTIAIPSYNAEGYLDHCMSTFIASGVIDRLDILIVNDGSTDSTGDLAASYEEKYPDCVTVISKQNGGHGSAINTAIAHATGMYFKVVDVDDWVEGDGLRALVDFLETTDVDLVLNPFFVYDQATGKTEIAKREIFKQLPYRVPVDFADLPVKFPLQMHEITYRTSMLQDDQVLLDEHTYYVDLEYVMFNVPKVKTVTLCENPVYVYRIGSQSQSVSHANLMKNVRQYRRVMVSCLSYWNRISPSLGEAYQHYMLRHMARSMDFSYYILLYFPPTKKLLTALKQWHRVSTDMMPTSVKLPYSSFVKVLVACHFHPLHLFVFANRIRQAINDYYMRNLAKLRI